MVKRGSKAKKKLNRIGEVLIEKGLTQSWLAGEMDKEFRTVNRWVNNHSQPPIQKLYEIAKALKISARELLYESLPK
ncbi:helix-turn-helix domain-containing protein [Dawidia soli]|uniref:Helix-turn-helix domain-containing protein n=1 Tax=Dawidia soli TaxID=2782352 RepID=A0AAP2D6G5_9BACT|nr:helix-turn-helix transcriptional regulator [Dawidia soli]MBT1686208.1 helix-turn-helix domain-containing protein [Dawidia soli]